MCRNNGRRTMKEKKEEEVFMQPRPYRYHGRELTGRHQHASFTWCALTDHLPLRRATFHSRKGFGGGGSRHFVNEICLTIWEWGIPSSRSVEIEIYVWCFLLWSPSPRTWGLRNMQEKYIYTGKALVYSYNRNVKHDTHEYWPKWIGSCVKKRSPKV